MQTLKEVDVGRENNLNLLRFLAATAVIFSHSYRVLTGRPGQDPVAQLTGFVPANLAVDVFFFVSGYLVTKSLFSRGSVGNFILARALRLIPALLVCTILSALVLGSFFTTLPLVEYLTRGTPYNYVFQNVILLSFATIPYGLPGVFEGLPEPYVVNGSLWTLPFEAWMYVSLAVLAVVGLLQRRLLMLAGTSVCVLLYLADELLGFVGSELISGVLRFLAFFYGGVCICLYRRFIPIAVWPAAVLGLLALLACLPGWQSAVVPVALAYGVLYFAFGVKGRILAFNKLGDFSYGLYVYAWPVQQSCVALVPQIGPILLSLVTFSITLVLAIGSWFLVEKPALRLKDKTMPRLPD